MPRSRRRADDDARTELRAWYLTSLRPKLARATAAGLARPAAVEELDRQVRSFLELPPPRPGARYVPGTEPREGLDAAA